MCGINGILGTVTNSTEMLGRMNHCIVHRGPDAEGIWESQDGLVHLGHRRLSIIELSPLGAQPMVSASERFVIVFNGEIYNFKEIKKLLSKDNPSIEFRGNSDTEILLSSIELLGIESTLDKIKGMFAFAVYDRETKTVTLARDRMGEKPLYYGRTGGRFVFASDIRSIESLDFFDNEINDGILYSYFRGGYIPAPYTIYKDIYKLEPGTYLTIKNPFSEWKVCTYWDIRNVALNGQNNPVGCSFEEAAEELENLIKASIRGQMIADVPLGAFLSGGIDSSLTVALMQSMSEMPIRTFTIGFEDEKYNEAEYALATANHLCTKHTQMYVTREDILKTIEEIPEAFGEPFADSSQIPTMLVSKMTKNHVTVSLSGDAGDEFYCGYNSYRDVAKGLEVLNGKLPFIKGNARKGLGNAVLSLGGKNNETLHKIAVSLCVNNGEDWYRNSRDDDLLLRKLPRNRQLRDKMDDYPNGFLKDTETNLMLMDMLQYLPDDILVKVDRAGMLYSLESRIPLLDRDVMEYAWKLPLSYKYDGKETKRILKHILYKYVPEEMMDRPKKGFSVPLAGWLKGGELSEWAGELIQSCKGRMNEYVDYAVVQKMWTEFLKTGVGERNIWNILMLSQWFEQRK